MRGGREIAPKSKEGSNGRGATRGYGIWRFGKIWREFSTNFFLFPYVQALSCNSGWRKTIALRFLLNPRPVNFRCWCWRIALLLLDPNLAWSPNLCVWIFFFPFLPADDRPPQFPHKKVFPFQGDFTPGNVQGAACLAKRRNDTETRFKCWRRPREEKTEKAIRGLLLKGKAAEIRPGFLFWG